MTKVIAANIILVLCVSTLHAQTPYYQGKTVTIVVGTITGDLYDLYARAIALSMGKYILGNPNIIVQNMPGAGHMIAAGQVQNTGVRTAAGDGAPRFRRVSSDLSGAAEPASRACENTSRGVHQDRSGPGLFGGGRQKEARYQSDQRRGGREAHERGHGTAG
jgi:hypothetical protein